MPISPPRWFLATAAIVALSLLVWHGTRVSVGVLDWDTYERLLFLPHYDLRAGTGDGHVLLHRTATALMALGLDVRAALLLLNALGFGALLAAATHVGRARGLTGLRLGLAVGVLAIASPGITAMVTMVEDNVLYHAPLLLALHALTAPGDSRRQDVRRGLVAGSMLALAMLTNITALVFLFLLPLAAILAALHRSGDAIRLTTAGAATLAVYYLFHATVLAGAPVAMHTFLPQALALRDFGPTAAPLLSLERLEQVLVGFRAMALRPTLHAMAAPAWLTATLSLVAPVVLLASYLVLARGALPARDADARAHLLPAAVAAVALAFPFFYEPVLIERWDMFWLVLWLGLVARLLRPLPRLPAGALAAALALQTSASVLVIAHQVGRVFETPNQAQTRQTLTAALAERAEAVVLPHDIDRQDLAHLYFHLQDRAVFLVGAGRGGATCHQEMIPLREVPRACAEVADALAVAERTLVDPRVTPGWAPDRRTTWR
ncbi:MAG: hypothetical protein KC731_40225 [Myxococcales bacterium]|nr:hypothetical protein [Myxococcales bacterium]